MRRIQLALRGFFSLYFWSISFLWMAVLWLLTVVLLPIFRYRETHSWIAAPGFRLCLLLGLNRIRWHYDAEFDRNRLSIFCQNHVNLIDAHVAAAVIPHAFCGLMNSWQFRIPIYGWMMGLSQGIRVYPGRKDNLRQMIAQAQQRREMGFSILTFPEGGRTADGKVHRFRQGVFQMARESGYPVVPIAVRGSFDINRKGSLMFRPFGTIDVWIGKQYETSGLSDDQLAQLAALLQSQVAKFVEGSGE